MRKVAWPTHALPYDVNCSILFTELPLLERPAAAQGGRLRRGRVLVAVRRPRCRPTARSTRFVRAVERRRRPAGRPELLRRRHAGRRPRPGVLAGPVGASSATTSRSPSASGSGSAAGRSTPSTATGSRAPPRRSRTTWRSRTWPWPAGPRPGSAGTVLVEPVSGADRYPLLTAADAVAVIDRVARRDRRGQPRSPVRPLPPGRQRRRPRPGHRRLRRPDRARADRRRARAPRAGHRRRSTSTATSPTLAAAGYDGWVGLEYKPSGASADSFGWLPPRAPRDRPRRPHDRRETA